MKHNIKILILGMFIGISVQAAIVRAGNITANGMYQGDLFTFLSNVVTMDTEIKTDHNSVFASYTGLENVVGELKTDYNALYANYTGAVNTVSEMKTDYNALFANYTAMRGQIVAFSSYSGSRDAIRSRSTTATAVAGSLTDSSTATTSTSKAAVAGDAVSTTSLTLTGL